MTIFIAIKLLVTLQR